MTNVNSLNIWYNTTLVGKLWQNENERMGFQYNDAWQKNGFPISWQMPLSQQHYPPEEKIAHRFFANLLPEGDARKHIAHNRKITEDDSFALLEAIGGECAGALSILPANATPNTTNRLDIERDYRLITDKEFKKWLLSYGNADASSDDKPRLSLAGAQEKRVVLFKDDHYFQPRDAAPSTHILKFELRNYKNVPAYEYYLAKLAESINLPVVGSQLKKHPDGCFLLIKRYDRVIISDKEIKRLHQEDFCQALGYSYKNKYQQHNGPSFVHCYKALQDASNKAIQDAENLLLWQIFNVLTGNSDAHAKNIAIIYDENQQITLAPFYDLVCTRAIEHLDHKLAMSVGTQFDPNKVGLQDWEQLAEECDIQPQYLKPLLKSTTEKLMQAAPAVRKQFEMEHGTYPALQRVDKIIDKQCKKLLRQL